MKEFQFNIMQNVIFGDGAVSRLGAVLKELGITHVLIITGPHLNRSGAAARLTEIVSAAGIAADVFAETEANPSVETVTRAAKRFLDCGADGIVAFGGGSPMDVAKAVGVVVRYGGSITDYEGADKVPGDIVPFVAIPTTAGTGSEVTAFSVITDHERNYKLTVFSYRLVPAYALLDPSFLSTVPASVAAATGIDAMVHALEAYLSKAASPFSDAMAEKALELLGANIRQFVADRGNSEAAAAMLTGSMFAGIAFAWARLGNVHAMAHPLSGYFDVAHGVANAILLPVVLEYNALADNGRYEKLYRLITGKRAEAPAFKPELLPAAVRELTMQLGLPQTLTEVGVTADKIPAMAADAMKSGNIAVNPRQTQQRDIEALYYKAL